MILNIIHWHGSEYVIGGGQLSCPMPHHRPSSYICKMAAPTPYPHGFGCRHLCPGVLHLRRKGTPLHVSLFVHRSGRQNAHELKDRTCGCRWRDCGFDPQRRRKNPHGWEGYIKLQGSPWSESSPTDLMLQSHWLVLDPDLIPCLHLHR
jgi:hypothetical protein